MIGQTISHYKILEKLGEGGMGVVYKAEDIKLKRIVALKFLPSHIISSKEELERFNIEAQAAAILNHPHICVIYAIDEENGSQFISMEYIDGTTLSKKIAQSPIIVNEALDYAIQIGEALQEAHSNGIIHRDIKSENIMVNSRNQIKVMDFGLAKLKGSLKITKASSTVGTLAYMAPEQIQGVEADTRSDIFSFGVVLFEMLTGNLPFKGEHQAAIMYSIVNEDPESLLKYLPNTDADLVHIINRALEKDIEDRYQSVNDMIIELRRLKKHSGRISGEILQEKKHTSAYKKPKDKPNKKKLFAGIGGSGIIAVLILGYFFLFNSSSQINKSVAVLPFKNLSADQDDFFSDGITEDITSELSRIGELKVIARNSVMQFKNSEMSLKEIGNLLGVSTILEGSIQRDNNQVRIVARLIDVNSGEYLWSDTYDKEMKQIFEIQSDVSKKIAAALKTELSTEEEKRIDKKPTENITAYQYYLKGREYYYQYDKQDNENAIKLFKQALELDPNYALAYAGLGDCYGQRVQKFGFPDEWLDSSIVVSNLSIKIDPNLSEGYKALALAEFTKGWIRKSLKTNKKAVELNPNYWPAVANYGVSLMYTGELAEAIKWINKGIQLSPTTAFGYVLVGRNYYFLQDFQKAETYLDKSLQFQPDFLEAYNLKTEISFAQNKLNEVIQACDKILSSDSSYAFAKISLGRAYIRRGNYNKAIEILKEVKSPVFRKITAGIYIAYAYKKLGRTDDFKNLIVKVKNDAITIISDDNDMPYDMLNMVFLSAIEGKKDDAFKWLNKAVDIGLRDIPIINDPLTENLRDDKEFKEIIRRIKDKVNEQKIKLASMDN